MKVISREALLPCSVVSFRQFLGGVGEVKLYFFLGLRFKAQLIRRGTGRRTGKAQAYDQRKDAMRFRLPALEKALFFTIVK